MSEKVYGYENLAVWQKAHQFVLDVYMDTKKFPREEIYGLTSQFRRAAVSIAANIAEGYRRHTEPEKARMMGIALGSADECSYYVKLSKGLGYEISDNLGGQNDEICRMLNAYINKIRTGTQV